jgi:DNA uptake protein ComE-like DNA-binding protein
MVLWVMVMLVLLAAGIAMMARTETQISRNYADVNRCRWAARAGVYGAIKNLTTLVASEPVYLGEDPYTVTSDDLSLDFGGYTFTATVGDEAGKINVNTATEDTLTQLFGSSDIADAIIGWRTPAGSSTTVVTNDDYYASLSPAYKCKSANLETVQELGLVKGITTDILGGTASSSSSTTLIDMLTVYAPLKAISPSVANQVDIETATRDSLQSSLGSVLSASDISSIISYRTRHPFKSPAEIVLAGISRSKIERIYGQLTVSGVPTYTGLVNINSASSDVLAVMPGLDAVTASAIVDYRTSNGAFSGVGYLLAVSSVSDDAFVSAAPYLTVNTNVFTIQSVGQLSSTGATATITCVVEIDSDGTSQIRYWQE